jgi:hypothetical protein
MSTKNFVMSDKYSIYWFIDLVNFGPKNTETPDSRLITWYLWKNAYIKSRSVFIWFRLFFCKRLIFPELITQGIYRIIYISWMDPWKVHFWGVFTEITDKIFCLYLYSRYCFFLLSTGESFWNNKNKLLCKK